VAKQAKIWPKRTHCFAHGSARPPSCDRSQIPYPPADAAHMKSHLGFGTSGSSQVAGPGPGRGRLDALSQPGRKYHRWHSASRATSLNSHGPRDRFGGQAPPRPAPLLFPPPCGWDARSCRGRASHGRQGTGSVGIRNGGVGVAGWVGGRQVEPERPWTQLDLRDRLTVVRGATSMVRHTRVLRLCWPAAWLVALLVCFGL